MIETMAVTSKEKIHQYDVLSQHLRMDTWYRICTQANGTGLWVLCAIMRGPDDSVDGSLSTFNRLLCSRLRGMIMRKSSAPDQVHGACVQQPLCYDELREMYIELLFMAVRLKEGDMTVPEATYLRCVKDAVYITRSHPYWADQGQHIVDALQVILSAHEIEQLYDHVNRYPAIKRSDMESIIVQIILGIMIGFIGYFLFRSR